MEICIRVRKWNNGFWTSVVFHSFIWEATLLSQELRMCSQKQTSRFYDLSESIVPEQKSCKYGENIQNSTQALHRYSGLSQDPKLLGE